MSLVQTDVAYSLFAIVNVVCNGFLIGRISERLGDRAMSNVGLACLASGLIGVAFAHAIVPLAIVLLLFAFGMALSNTGITALISKAASAREQGTVLGTSSSLDSLSGILAPPASTGLLGTFGPGFAGAAPAAFVTLALAMGLFAARGEAPVAGVSQDV
jgi:MFS family permease